MKVFVRFTTIFENLTVFSTEYRILCGTFEYLKAISDKVPWVSLNTTTSAQLLKQGLS